ncbi:aromatic ring-hydroxylating oxygenase subunit alpha [Nitrogeniibacter aestuarii]|uniref:aromatic ring-hydroxylating oxygenase subunit alpha n=1 Tax=Nitrogeniibacter aestuarii TaxID=2815343 RepID=UPI001D117532|nr:aromatic ring-hydroxylating dioxygenase subunit alpha [Nitrogeniibacter aestuarii]
MKVSNEVRELIASREAGFNLEAPFYTSDEIFNLDMEVIFGQHWVYVGVEPDIPEPGDYFTVKLGRASIVVLRDDDMNVTAFHNVCRHRGAELCSEQKGSVGNLVCPYHQWTYDLTGQLIHTEHMGQEFECSKVRLKPVHVGNIAGLIFICLADEPPADFEQMRATMEEYIAPHRVADCKVVAQDDYIEAGNWKLTMENNRECYHCVSNHPELTQSLYEFGFGYQPNPSNADEMKAFTDLIGQEHARWEAAGFKSAEVEKLDGCATGFRTQRLPLTRDGESQTLDSKVACQKLLGDLTERKLGGLSFWTQPNSWHHFMSDHIVTFTVLPIDSQRSLLRTKWLVHKDAVEGRDYDVKRLTEVWIATNRQDGALVEMSQRGAVSPAYQPGPYSPYTEAYVEKFANWYIERLNTAVA